MSEFRIDQIKNQAGTGGPDVAGITTFTGTSGIVIPSGNTTYRGGRGRGVVAAGVSPGQNNTMQYITIATTGNATDFGDLITASGYKRRFLHQELVEYLLADGNPLRRDY